MSSGDPVCPRHAFIPCTCRKYTWLELDAIKFEADKLERRKLWDEMWGSMSEAELEEFIENHPLVQAADEVILEEKREKQKMLVNEYQDGALETAIYPGSGGIGGLNYTILGLTGEAGELANCMKKIYRDNHGVVSLEFRDKLKAELSDVLWYCATTAHELGFTLEDVCQYNLDKLAKRKAENKLHGSGDAR